MVRKNLTSSIVKKFIPARKAKSRKGFANFDDTIETLSESVQEAREEKEILKNVLPDSDNQKDKYSASIENDNQSQPSKSVGPAHQSKESSVPTPERKK